MSTRKIELSVGSVKVADKYELFTEEEIDNINKIPELEERVDIVEDEIEESLKFEIVGEGAIQLYVDKKKEIKGYPITSPDRVIDENGVNIKEEIEEINSSLENMESKKLDKNGILSMANMGQDIKSAMTGGSVAIVGKDTILKENIVTKQVTPSKTSFLKLNREKNYFNGDNYIYGAKITGDKNYANIVADENSNIAIIPIVGGKTYSIILKQEDLELEYDGAKYFKYMTSSNFYSTPQNGIEVTLNSAHYGTNFTITTSEKDNYLYLYVSNTNKTDTLIQVIEGLQDTLTIKNYEECFEPTFTIHNELFKKVNLFEGKYLKNISISGSTINDITLKSSTGAITAIIPIERNKDYSVILSETPLTYSDYTFFKWVTSDTLYNGEVYQGKMSVNQCGSVIDLKHLNFTSGENDKYLYLYTNRDNRIDILIEVTEGKQTELSIKSNEDIIYKPSEKLSVYSKAEINELLNKICDTNNVNKDNIAWFGDSISKLKELPHLVGEKIKANIYDCSVAGSVMVKQIPSNINHELLGFCEISKSIKSGDFSIQENARLELDNKDGGDRYININTLKSIDFGKIDKLVALYGTNDFYHQVITLEEFKQGMRDAITNILSTYPHIQMYFISPIWRGDETPKPKNYELLDYVRAEEEVCNEFNIPFFNLYKNCGINNLNSSIYLNSDKLHQNEKGDVLLADKCAKFLLNN